MQQCYTFLHQVDVIHNVLDVMVGWYINILAHISSAAKTYIMIYIYILIKRQTWKKEGSWQREQKKKRKKKRLDIFWRGIRWELRKLIVFHSLLEDLSGNMNRGTLLFSYLEQQGCGRRKFWVFSRLGHCSRNREKEER